MCSTARRTASSDRSRRPPFAGIIPAEPWNPADRKHRTVHGRTVHRKVYDSVFGVRPGMDDLFGMHGVEDAYASFYIEVQALPRRGELPTPPTRIYRGSTGNPARDVEGYAPLRRAFDAATALF